MKFENPAAQKLYDNHVANKRWIRTVAIITLAICGLIALIQYL